MTKNGYNSQTSNRDCCRNLFYLCNQAMINYDAELKNKKTKKNTYDEKVTLGIL